MFVVITTKSVAIVVMAVQILLYFFLEMIFCRLLESDRVGAERDRQTDRQADRQKSRQTGRQTNWLTE